jgi:hypothetical protein
MYIASQFENFCSVFIGSRRFLVVYLLLYFMCVALHIFASSVLCDDDVSLLLITYRLRRTIISTLLPCTLSSSII